MITDPVDAPLQSTLVTAVVAVMGAGCVTTTAVAVAVHPLASFRVTV
jgi:hypothetical protein